MSWGNARYLENYWNNINLLPYTPNNFGSLNYEVGCADIVKLAIKSLHIDQQNADVENKYIVIGNGATQILNGLIYLLGKNKIFAEKPYFSRFPLVSQIYQKDFSSNPDLADLEIITWPNNPDNDYNDSQTNCLKIHDLSYNWLQYTIPENFNEDIMVFSLSKATGHASTRFGWVILNDKELAEKLEMFIEITTAGVSIESQKKFLGIINHEAPKGYPVFDYAQIVLAERWNAIETFKSKFNFDILNNSGMFMWCKGEIPEIVHAVPGSEFGETDEYFRLNIGCSNSDFKDFIDYYEKS